jgi:hypothetical protein
LPCSGHKLAKLDAFLNADSPELVAELAVGFDWMASIEQSTQIGECIARLQLFALASRARRCKDNRFTHGFKTTARGPPQVSEEGGWTRR